nr:MAG TPA: hypothetical protein [Caudoviricetes sp.]DAX52420.1 MAG TPA: hypothetical protein [Caudoviricetes sp.]
MKIYPYLLKVKVSQAPTINDDGIPSYPSDPIEWKEIGICRDEITGSGQKISKVDGQIFECTATVYAPKNTPKIEAGTTLQVVDLEGNIRLEKQVIRFSRDYFHCRIFV